MKKINSLLVLAVLLFASCDKEQSVVEEQLPEQELSGEEVFKTVFFYLGDEARTISGYEEQIALLDKSQLENEEFMEHYEASAVSYMDKVMEKDPHFVDALRDAVQSKDFEKIEAAMIYGSNLMMALGTIDALAHIEHEELAGNFSKLDLQSYDFSDSKALEKFFAEIDGVMKASGFDAATVQGVENPNLALNLTNNLIFSQINNWNWNWSWNWNWNWNYSWQFHFSYNYNRVLNFVNTYDFDTNLNFVQIQSLVQIQAFDLAAPIITGAKYDNYAGERLIEEIALAF